MPDEIYHGRVIRLFTAHAYGFLSCDELPDEHIFFHFNEMSKDYIDVQDGDFVSYRIVPGKKGRTKAISTKLIKRAE